MAEANQSTPPVKFSPQLLLRFDQNGCAIRQDFGYALHDFGGVVAEADDRVRSVLRGMHQQQFVSFAAGSFAQVGQNGDIAADDGLQRTMIPRTIPKLRTIR